jgi:hypothetical protein
LRGWHSDTQHKETVQGADLRNRGTSDCRGGSISDADERFNLEEGKMRTLTTILAAAFIAGGASVAMAQGAGADVNPDRIGKGADQNPSAPNANPAAGNTDATTAGQAKTGTKGGAMTTAPVSGTTQSKDSSTPSQAPTGTSK